MSLKHILAGLDLAILATGVLLWLAGKITRTESLRTYGTVLLYLWVLVDLAILILAILLGWFA